MKAQYRDVKAGVSQLELFILSEGSAQVKAGISQVECTDSFWFELQTNFFLDIISPASVLDLNNLYGFIYGVLCF